MLGIRSAACVLAVGFSCFVAGTALADDHFVRADAPGGDGSDWTNAFVSLPDNLLRGDTYYVADGDYGSYRFDDDESGSIPITIKKATAADHGTDSGWDDTYGDGSADFGAWNFSTSHWVVDGVVGQGADDHHGIAAPNGWKPYVAYGFRVRSGSSADQAKVIRIGTSFSCDLGDITIKHVEAAFTNTPGSPSAWGSSADIFYILGTNVTLSYSWVHDAGRVNFLHACDGFLVEHSVLERNGHGAAAGGGDTQHSEIYSGDHVDDHTFRYNLIRDWRSTGGLILHNDNGEPPPITNWRAYGNVFTTTGYWAGQVGDANGVINALSDSEGTSAYVYNNTFVDIAYGCSVLAAGNYASRVVRNNIFYNCRRLGSSGAAIIGGDRSHNWYFGSGDQSEPDIQLGAGDPFVALASHDYRLVDETDPGYDLGAPYNADPLGSVRGADGVWDRGAFEHGEGAGGSGGAGGAGNVGGSGNAGGNGGAGGSSAPDGGGAASDAGGHDAGAYPATGQSEEDDGGCGCRTHPSSLGWGWLLLGRIQQ